MGSQGVPTDSLCQPFSLRQTASVPILQTERLEFKKAEVNCCHPAIGTGETSTRGHSVPTPFAFEAQLAAFWCKRVFAQVGNCEVKFLFV